MGQEYKQIHQRKAKTLKHKVDVHTWERDQLKPHWLDFSQDMGRQWACKLMLPV